MYIYILYILFFIYESKYSSKYDILNVAEKPDPTR